jgi:parallel beta-helix repeat protein
MHASGIQYRLLGMLAVGTICLLFAFKGAGNGCADKGVGSPSAAGHPTVVATNMQDGTKKGPSSVTVSSSGSVFSSVPSGTSVKSSPYSAYGDGVHDDTAAIQACINTVSGTGGTVIVPAGTFMVNTQTNSRHGISLGSNMTFYLSAGATLQAITTSSGNTQGNVLTAVGVTNLIISGPGTVKGDRATHTGPQKEGFMGLYITGSNVTVSGPTFSYNFADGIYVGGGSNTNIKISGVTCDNNGRNAMSITNATTMLVSGCTFSNTSGTAPGCGIDIEPNSGNLCSGIHVTGCTFFNNIGGGLGLGPSYSDRLTTFVTGCLIENNEFSGNGSATLNSNYGDFGAITLSSCIQGYPNTIQNNNLHNNYGVGIKFLYSSGHIVTGNTITNTTGEGTQYSNGTAITLFNSDYNTVTGNTITNNAGGGVWFVGAAAINIHNKITPNTFSGNGGAKYPAATF